MEQKQTKEKKSVLWFHEISIHDIPLVGGKNASLGEMYSNLTAQGVAIPNGFAITSGAYWDFLRFNKLDVRLKEILKGLNVHNVSELARVGKKIRTLVERGSFPPALRKEIELAYKELSKKEKAKNLSVAVRSSATAEDLPGASFAGQQETYLNVVGLQQLLLAVKKCIASLFTDRAISYREANGFHHMDVALSVAVQHMVRSDIGASGVMFTLDTESGFDGVVLLSAAYGLGEYVVKGRVTPDQFYLFKKGLAKGKKSLISKRLGSKEAKLVYQKKGGTKQEKVPAADRLRFSISDDDAIILAKWGMQIESYYGRPQDLEWAKDGATGKLYIVQARPETVQTKVDRGTIREYQLKKEGEVLLTGIAVGQKIGAGSVRIINDPKDMRYFKKGDVLVTRITDPDWEPIMRIASAIVTEQGGKTSHAAIVSREIGVPAIVGATGARTLLKNGEEVTVDCTKGDEGRIFKGKLPFEVRETELSRVPKTKTKIMMNIGDPDHAFELSFIPNDGIGLARLEFIFNTFIKIHPLALVHYKDLKDKVAKKKIEQMTRGYKNKEEFCIDRLSDGIARLAAAYHPHDVIVRLSDFKTNEYATMIGGKEFEPKEENPMIGWRGASRYYSDHYKAAFRLECEAIRRVRDVWGLDNVVVMVPFCRTPEEGEKVLETMKEFGLERGKNGLRVIVMCEIPSNVILAEEFAKIFDGFSIGSNDLTQLVLGVDRDSSVVSDLYDAGNPAVKSLIQHVIRVAKKHKKYIGICGQAPSDSPAFAEFLVREGIESISLNPDTVVTTRERIAAVEKTIGRTGRKTNRRAVSLIVALGAIGMSLVSLGMGCTNEMLRQNTSSELSPGQIRLRAEENVARRVAAGTLGGKTLYTAHDFATFSLLYPTGWATESWDGGVSFHDASNTQYVSIFKQRTARTASGQEKEVISIDGLSGVIYSVALPENKGEIVVVELQTDKGVIEINGRGPAFKDILSSLHFGTAGSLSDGLLDKKMCAQVITYASEKKDGSCSAFPTPCDVPDGWASCTP